MFRMSNTIDNRTIVLRPPSTGHGDSFEVHYDVHISEWIVDDDNYTWMLVFIAKCSRDSPIRLVSHRIE